MTEPSKEQAMRRELGARLRAAREWARLEQRTVAEHLGIHPDTLKGYESGRRRAPLEHVEEIAAFTGAPLWFLRGGWDGWRDTASAEPSPAMGQVLRAVEDLQSRMRILEGSTVVGGDSAARERSAAGAARAAQAARAAGRAPEPQPPRTRRASRGAQGR